jgi:co-chaperonin GroES (HSP10)
MFKPTANKIAVKLKTKWIGNMSSIFKLSSIENNSSLNPADLVNIAGKVVAVPDKLIYGKREYEGYELGDIRVGDNVIFSHSVVFDFLSTLPEQEPIHKNSVWYKDGEYFLADITDIFAVVRDGKILMQNDWVMLSDMEKESKIFVPNEHKKKRTAAATVEAIKTNPHIKSGDRIYFNPIKLALYQLDGIPFGIIKGKEILGKDYRPVKDWPVTGASKHFFDN